MLANLDVQSLEAHANYVFRIPDGTQVVKIAGPGNRFFNLLSNYALGETDVSRVALYEDKSIRHKTVNDGVVKEVPTYQTLSRYAYYLLGLQANGWYGMSHVTQPQTNLVVLDPVKPIDDGNVVVVQEYVEGPTLHDFIKEGGTLEAGHMLDMETFCENVEPFDLGNPGNIRVKYDASGKPLLSILDLEQPNCVPPAGFFKNGSGKEVGPAAAVEYNRSLANGSLIGFADTVRQGASGKAHLKMLKCSADSSSSYFASAIAQIDQKLSEYKE